MKTKSWLRLYHEFADDPKIQMLAFDDQRHYVMCLCLKGRGVLESATPNEEYRERMVAKALGLDLLTAKEVKRRLMEPGLIDGSWHPVNWAARQFESDSSTDRVKRHREKQKRFGNVSVTVDETGNETSGETGSANAGTPPSTDSGTQLFDPTGTQDVERSGNVSVTAQIRSEQIRSEVKSANSRLTIEEKDRHLERLVAELPGDADKVKRGSMRQRHAKFWQTMRSKFGAVWFNTHGAEPTPAWIELLDTHTQDAAIIDLALELLRFDWHKNFPPGTDAFEPFLKRAVAKAAPQHFDETDRRRHWFTHATSEVLAAALTFGLVKYGARADDLPSHVRALMNGKVSALVDQAINFERPPATRTYKVICEWLEGEVRLEMRQFRPATVAERSSDAAA